MDEPTAPGRVLQMRLVVEAPDYEQAVAFYRDVLGAPEELTVEGDAGEMVTILDMGRATLELSNPAQVAMIDDVEVGRRISPRLRVAFEVADARAVTNDLVDADADLLAPPTFTPWRSLNSRLAAPANLQITLFEELVSCPSLLCSANHVADDNGRPVVGRVGRHVAWKTGSSRSGSWLRGSSSRRSDSSASRRCRYWIEATGFIPAEDLQ
jgi:lactoylglutathione lyase